MSEEASSVKASLDEINKIIKQLENQLYQRHKEKMHLYRKLESLGEG